MDKVTSFVKEDIREHCTNYFIVCSYPKTKPDVVINCLTNKFNAEAYCKVLNAAVNEEQVDFYNHAHWEVLSWISKLDELALETHSKVFCSNCNFCEPENNLIRYKFCPHCGSLMDNPVEYYTVFEEPNSINVEKKPMKFI